MTRLLKINKYWVAAYCLFAIVSVFVVGGKQAHATVYEDGSTYPWFVNNAYDHFCRGITNLGVPITNQPISQPSANTAWLSIAGNPGQTTTSVNRGDPLDIDLNVGVRRCYPNQNTGIFWDYWKPYNGSYSISNGGPQNINIPSLNPTNPIAAIPPNILTPQNGRDWWRFPIDTNQFPSSGGTFTLTINATTRQYSHRDVNGNFMCIMSPPQIVMQTHPNWRGAPNNDIDNICPTNNVVLSIVITILPQDDIPNVSINAIATCSAAAVNITGDATDPQGVTSVNIEIRNNVGGWDLIQTLSNHTGSFSVLFPDNYKDAMYRTIRVTAINNSTGTTGPAASNGVGTIDVPPCIPPSCSLSTNPSTVEPNVQFNLVLTWLYSPGGLGRPISPSGRASFNGGPQKSGTSVPPTSNSGGGITFNPAESVVSAGTYNSNGALIYNNGVANVSVPCNNGSNFIISVATRPYFKIYGNDAMAGSTFANVNTCSGTANTSATFIGFNPAGTTIPGGAFNYQHGAGAQYALFALGTIVEVPSSALRPYNFDNTNLGGIGPTNIYPSRQSFSNVSSAGIVKGSDYGGDSGISRCMPDFWSKAPSPSIFDSVEIGSDGIAALQPTSGVIATIKVNITRPFKQVVYIDGDARIEDGKNIQYSNFTNADNASNLTVIVRGNLYIDNDTTRLDGTYIAQPRPGGAGGGLIITCFESSGNGRAFTDTEVATQCNRKLTVNGALIAKQVIPLRTNGHYRDGVIPELPGSSSIAEEFDFGPEIYLQPPNLTDTNTANKSKYDAINVLPPVF